MPYHKSGLNVFSTFLLLRHTVAKNDRRKFSEWQLLVLCLCDNYTLCNEKKSAASLCHQVAALVPDRFGKFYLVENQKIANNSATTEATEKISAYLESFEI